MADDEVFMESEDDFVRPFLVTAGRTRSSVGDLRMETMVEQTGSDTSRLRFEAGRVMTLCTSAISIAEVSAHLRIPIGTAKVLVGDLISLGHLKTHQTIDTHQLQDLNMIQRLIAGVRAL